MALMTEAVWKRTAAVTTDGRCAGISPEGGETYTPVRQGASKKQSSDSWMMRQQYHTVESPRTRDATNRTHKRLREKPQTPEISSLNPQPLWTDFFNNCYTRHKHTMDTFNDRTRKIDSPPPRTSSRRGTA